MQTPMAKCLLLIPNYQLPPSHSPLPTRHSPLASSPKIPNYQLPLAIRQLPTLNLSTKQLINSLPTPHSPPQSAAH